MENSPLMSNTQQVQTKPRTKRSKPQKVKDKQSDLVPDTLDDFVDSLIADAQAASQEQGPIPSITQAERDTRLAQLATANQQLADICASLDKLIEIQIMYSWYLDRAKHNLRAAQSDLTGLRQNIEVRPVVD